MFPVRLRALRLACIHKITAPFTWQFCGARHSFTLVDSALAAPNPFSQLLISMVKRLLQHDGMSIKTFHPACSCDSASSRMKLAKCCWLPREATSTIARSGSLAELRRLWQPFEVLAHWIASSFCRPSVQRDCRRASILFTCNPHPLTCVRLS